MTEPEYLLYRRRAIRNYAAEKTKAGNWPAEAARKLAERDYDELLPNGQASPNQHLFSIVDESSGVRVGVLWFGLIDPAPVREAFLFDFMIYREFCRRGYGSQALQALEAKVKELGLDRISLHVFGHNQSALALYQKMGYAITNINMCKRLSQLGE
jgi:ribosomal protein S18 acetylase RimI-like enzyme